MVCSATIRSVNRAFLRSICSPPESAWPLRRAPRRGAVLLLGEDAVGAGQEGLRLASALLAASGSGLIPLALLRVAAGCRDQGTLHRWEAGTWHHLAQVQLPTGLPPSPARRRREWPAIQLPALPRSGATPWPASAGTAAAAIGAALAWLRLREPRLMLPHLEEPWRSQVPDAALAAALLQLCGEGRRVVWQLPPGAYAGLEPVLLEAWRRNLGPKLLLPSAELPALEGEAAARSWILDVGAPSDAEAVLAWALAQEDPVLIGLADDPCDARASTATVPEPYRPGSGRWLASGTGGTVVVTAPQAAVALAAAQELGRQGIGLGVFHCTSLAPLPMAQLLAAPRPCWLMPGALAGFASACAVHGLDAAVITGPEQLVRAVLSAHRGPAGG